MSRVRSFPARKHDQPTWHNLPLQPRYSSPAFWVLSLMAGMIQPAIELEQRLGRDKHIISELRFAWLMFALSLAILVVAWAS